MFPDLAMKVKGYAANMGSGFVVIAGFLLAIAMVFIIVFARWNQVENSSSVYSMNSDKPKIESSVDESGYVAVVLPDRID
ncbi:MAG: hypothetical protein K5875_10350 [Saccharofermentans sp.]|nr:hypothetical protein [Clostridiales bacterium]MCR4768347.1 hypothetical protein [Saccharofermentans sp.]